VSEDEILNELDHVLPDISRIAVAMNPIENDRDASVVAMVMNGVAALLLRRRVDATKLAESNWIDDGRGQ